MGDLSIISLAFAGLVVVISIFALIYDIDKWIRDMAQRRRKNGAR